MRRLQVSFAGYAYTAFTIGLGVVALMTGNNVLYLIESLLLSGMTLNGVLSERCVAAIDVEFRRYPVSANSPSKDQIRVRNRGKNSIFCIEVGEWKDKKLVPAAFIPYLAARSELVVPSKMILERRGLHRWDGLAVATRYPFGLAKKIRVLKSPGDRLVWPEKFAVSPHRELGGERGTGTRPGQDFAEGEVRFYAPEDDSRNIVWTLSVKGGDPYVRVRRSDREDPRVCLDLRTEPGPEFERKVIAAAQAFYRQDGRAESGTLILRDNRGARSFHGGAQSLNQLAVVQAGEGNAA